MANSVTIPKNKQEFNDYNCGPVSLLNIYEYFNVDKNINAIHTEINSNSNQITYLPQLALNLHMNNFKVEYLSSNPYRVSRSWSKFASDEVYKMYKKYVTKNKNNQWSNSDKHLLNYLSKGGILKVKNNITSELIDNLLDQKRLILVNIEQSWIYGSKLIPFTNKFDDIDGKTSGHFIVIYKKKGSSYYFMDPFPLKKEILKVDKDILLTSLCFWNPELVSVKS